MAALEAEQRLDLCVLYAAGDESGPLSDLVRIGLSGRNAYPGEIKTLRTYRSSPVVVRLELFISGKPAGARLRSAIEHRLRSAARSVQGSWWRATADELQSLARQFSIQERIRVMTETEAVEAEQKARNEIMDRMV